MTAIFTQQDQILPKLTLPDPCLVEVKITDKDVVLRVGQRDWQWNIADGKLVGCGTSLTDGGTAH